MADTEFLSFLVDETLKLHTNGAKDLSHLESKLQDYKLEFIKGEFIPQTQMLRFKTNFGLLDVPANWSFFALDDHTVVDEKSDHDYILSVFKKNWNGKFEKILMTHSDGFCYLIGLKSGEDFHLRDLTNSQEILKAA